MSKSKTKKQNGQFYTTHNASYILKDLPFTPDTCTRIIEPFAGKGDLIQWARSKGWKGEVEAYDIDPKGDGIIQRDTLLDPPDYTDGWILTNPPYLARNKSEKKEVFDMYEANDLYKCFIRSLCQTKGKSKAKGGILIIPVGFFLSPRDIDEQVRGEFLSTYRITGIRYFEEDVFPDTPTTVVALSFEQIEGSAADSQTIRWTRMPQQETREFTLEKKYGWIIGGEVYTLKEASGIRIRRWVEGMKLEEGEQRTGLTLTALDSGTAEGRIGLYYRKGYVYPAKDTSRAFATLCIRGLGRVMTDDEQERIAKSFCEYVEDLREKTWSLFLPAFRESKEYARKRMPFELGYKICSWLIKGMNLGGLN